MGENEKRSVLQLSPPPPQEDWPNNDDNDDDDGDDDVALFCEFHQRLLHEVSD